MTHPSPKRNMVPKAVLMRSGLVSLITARPVNTAQPRSIVNSTRPMTNVFNKAHSTVRRPINNKTTTKKSNFNQGVNTVKNKNVNTARTKAIVNTAKPKVVLNAVKGNQVNVVKASACCVWKPKTKDQGVIDSGCSRHMTGNMSYLTDFEEIDGGYVAFGGNPKGGKITERVPRKNNMYSVDLKNIVPKGVLTCLFAKATSDESKFWHRRSERVESTKDETSGIFKSFITRVENLLYQRVKVIRCDNGTEFKNKEMNQFYERKGIKREFSIARTPQQNGVAKRKNRTLIEAARTMLVDSKLPTTFWAEAVNTASCVQNRVLVTKPHNKTHYELFLGRKPALGFMRPFRCPVTILNTIDHLGKFNGKADKGFFVGYSINSKAFRVFNSRTRIVEENLHVQFSENTPNITESGPNWLFDIDSLTKSINYKPVVAGNQSNHNAGTKACNDAVANEKNVTEEPRKEGGDSNNDQEKEDDNVNSTNNVNTASDGNSINNVNAVSSTLNATGIEVNDVGSKISIELTDDLNMPKLEDIVYSDDDEDVGAEANMNSLNTIMPVSPIPTTRIHKDHPVEQIIRDLNSAPQTRRMIKNLEEHGLFSSVQQRTNHKTLKIACLLAFYHKKNPKRNKKDERGIIIKNKARLVTQGYTQEERIDYDEVFAPVARIEAIRLFLAYASYKDFVVYQMDVKSDFLYCKIEEEVYVCQPPGFEDLDFPDRVYKVQKALYGLHQALRAWYETLSPYLLDNRFKRRKIDKTLFIRRDKGDILLVQVYVDDIIFGSTKKSLCTEFENMMHKKFQMGSMGELTFFLGLQVKQKDDGIFISQDKYVTKILKKFGFTDVKTASTPMETQKPLLKDEDGEEVDVHLYRSRIGSLMYLTSSRPDIMFAVCACARYQVNPKVSHLYAVKRIFRYLKDKRVYNKSCHSLVVKIDFMSCKNRLWLLNSITEAEIYSKEKKLIQMIKIQLTKNVVDLHTKAFDVHVAYRLETWAHVYSFKVNPCNGRDMWPIIEFRTVILPPCHKSQVGRPPKKRKKSVDELASQSCSTGKQYGKGKSVKCSKCGNLGHNRKGCRGQGGASQGGGSSQQSATPSQASGARNSSSQADGYGQPSASPSQAMAEDGVANIKRWHQDHSNDGVGTLTTGSERSRLKETLEDSASQDKDDYSTCARNILKGILTMQQAQLVENEVVRVMIPKCMSWLDAYDEPIGDMEDKVDNPSTQNMSSASSAVTYTSVYTDSEPGRVFWGANEEISNGGSPRVIVLGYDRLPMQPVAPPSPDYIPGPEEPQTPTVPQDEDEHEPMFIQPHDPDYVPEPIYPEYIPLEDEHEFPVEEQPLPPVDSPTAESPGYVVESDPEEDPEEYEDDETEDGPVDYPMDGGEDGDDDDGDSSGDDADDEDEDEEDEDKEDEEEEEHLAPADSAIVVPTVELVSPPEGTKPVIPPPSTDITTTGARITVRLQASISLPPEAEVERLLAMPTPPPLLASTQALIDAVTAALPSPPLPPLPPSLYIPPPVDRRDDIPESERPPRKRSCLFALGSRYEVGESSTARPTGGRGIDYGFVSTVYAKARRRGIREVGYGIRDTWVDPAEAVPEIAPMTMGEVNTRVTELAELHDHDTQDLYALLKDA
ncbi:putative ribonuclease H-like domain-containing protein [Tanacetum coccineum]|uniref:Ribonuclease H-like domain-containing protein n=1 Tax=Tanacetum coccineum TaxID=301880 RepID=A0ABQ5F2U9_9ASTR